MEITSYRVNLYEPLSSQEIYYKATKEIGDLSFIDIKMRVTDEMNQTRMQTIRRVAAALPGMESSDAAGNGEKPQNYREVVLNDDKIPDQHMQEGGCSC